MTDINYDGGTAGEPVEIPKIQLIEEMLLELRLLELREVVDMAQQALEKREIEELDHARRVVQEMAENLNIPPEHLIGAKSGNGQAKDVRKPNAKLQGYRNPDNPSQTWSGKGRKPAWFTDAVGAGTPIDSMRI